MKSLRDARSQYRAANEPHAAKFVFYKGRFMNTMRRSAARLMGRVGK